MSAVPSNASRVQLRDERTSREPASDGEAGSYPLNGHGNEELEPDAIADERERFIPVTRFALIDRLTEPHIWPNGQAADARRFFRYLDYWRQQQYGARLLGLEQDYEPFSPDSDLLMTRSYTEEERRLLQQRVVAGIDSLLKQANYTRINPKQVELILTRESHYGLDLQVDLDAFEELLIYYRGATTRTHHRRSLKSFLRKQEIDVPIFRRLFVLFKLKSEEQRIEELVRERGVSRGAASRAVRRMRRLLAPEVRDDLIYMKLFKNIPRSDIEMIFPNTRVRFRPFDKLKLGITSSAGVGMGAFSAAGKLALLTTNPLAAAGAVFGLGGIIFRQCRRFLNERQRYMVIMAQNLYFHAMADNRGVLIKLASRAAEEDMKEEILLYAVLAKGPVRRSDLPEVDRVIERYMEETFGVDVDFEIEDALERLIAEGIVSEAADGTLHTLPPAEAARLIDRKWDAFLDLLPGSGEVEGTEMRDGNVVQANVSATA
jgi:hypothetical protein